LTSAAGGLNVLTNCTVTNNTAGDGGGGLYNGASSSTLLTNCTVVGNAAAGPGGGLDNAGIPVGLSLMNTIVAGNKGVDISGSFNNAGGNLIDVDVLLAPLGSYGGSTQTFALLPGSPAIGGGVSGPSVPTNDQRGQGRSGGIDIGSFQSQGFILTPAAKS